MSPVPHPDTIRGPIEQEFNGNREAIERYYAQSVRQAQEHRHEDLESNQQDKEAALVAAGLNADGSVPSNYGSEDA